MRGAARLLVSNTENATYASNASNEDEVLNGELRKWKEDEDRGWKGSVYERERRITNSTNKEDDPESPKSERGHINTRQWEYQHCPEGENGTKRDHFIYLFFKGTC